MRQKPLLLVDIDGVISLFGSPAPWIVDESRGEADEIQIPAEAEQISGAPEADEIQIPAEAEQISGAPEAEQIPGAPEAEQIPGAPEAEQIPGAPEAEQISGAPEAEQIPGPQSGTQPIDGSLHTIEGIPHFLSRTAAAHLHELSAEFELVWASGWEERADEHLPHLLGLPSGLPHLRFEPQAGKIRSRNAHWKLDAIDAYAQARPLAWIDDSFDDSCHEWATARTISTAPTLLVQTDPARGLTSLQTRQLLAWAASGN